MVDRTIQVDSIQFCDATNERGEDGAVYYLILSACPDGNKCNHVCLSHPRMTHEYDGQHFRRGAFSIRTGATQEKIDNDLANLWGWDGNQDAPTLTPSFGAFPINAKTGKPSGRAYNAHLFFTAGRIQLCGDATVSVHPNPVRCRFPDELTGREENASQTPPQPDPQPP